MIQLSFEVKRPAHHVFDCLSKVEKFVSVHPVISKIEPISESKYLVCETLQFLFIPLRFTYPVIISSNVDDNTVVFKAVVLKLIHLDMEFVIRPKNGFSHVEENVSIKSILPIKTILRGALKKHHTQLFLNIEELK